MALDKISKKFDKRRDTAIRAENGRRADRRLQEVVRFLHPDEVPAARPRIPPFRTAQPPAPQAIIPPDTEGSAGGSSAGDNEPSRTAIFLCGVRRCRPRRRLPCAHALAPQAVSGMCSRTLTAPLDRIKVIMQAGGGRKVRRSAHLRHRAADAPLGQMSVGGGQLLDVGRSVVEDGGASAPPRAVPLPALTRRPPQVRALWQGNGANVLKVAPESAVKFLVYDLVKGWLLASCSSPRPRHAARG